MNNVELCDKTCPMDFKIQMFTVKCYKSNYNIVYYVLSIYENTSCLLCSNKDILKIGYKIKWTASYIGITFISNILATIHQNKKKKNREKYF